MKFVDIFDDKAEKTCHPRVYLLLNIHVNQYEYYNIFWPV